VVHFESPFRSVMDAEEECISNVRGGMNVMQVQLSKWCFCGLSSKAGSCGPVCGAADCRRAAFDDGRWCRVFLLKCLLTATANHVLYI